jgi:DNA-binding response OmpR family regulator
MAHVQSSIEMRSVCPEGSMGCKRVIVVTDSEKAGEILHAALASCGYLCMPTEDLDQTVEEQCLEGFDLVVVDCLRATVDPGTVINILADKGFNDIPVIVLGMKSTMSSVMRAYGAGASVYLPKPFSKDIFIDTVKYLIGDLPPEERERIEQRLIM